MFAEKVRMERFQHNFQLKEVTPTVGTALRSDMSGRFRVACRCVSGVSCVSCCGEANIGGVERMVDHDERPFEVVHRWIKEGFKLSMDEKWRFVFTFSQAVQGRLLRKTKRLLFAQVRPSTHMTHRTHGTRHTTRHTRHTTHGRHADGARAGSERVEAADEG